MARKPTHRSAPTQIELVRVRLAECDEMMAAAQSIQEWEYGAYSVQRNECKVLVYYAWSNLVCHADLDEHGEIECEHYNDYLPSELDNAELHATGRELLQARPWLWSADDERSDRKAGGKQAGAA